MKLNALLFSTVILPLVLLHIIYPESARAGGLIKLVESGQTEPGTSNVYSEISESPTLNDIGQVCFTSDLRSNGFLQGYGVYLVDGNTVVSTVAHYGQPTPDLNGNLYSFYSVAAINNSNQAFQANLHGTLGGGTDDSGFYENIAGSLTQLAREGYAAPNTNGTFKSSENVPIQINRAGQTAFSTVTTSNPAVAYRSTGSTLTRIAYYGEASPDGNGIISGIGSPALNNNGQVAFSCSLIPTNSSIQGFIKGDGNSLTLLARLYQTVPNGDGYFQAFRSTAPAFNDSGQIAFESTLAGTSAGTADNAGLYRADGATTTELLRKGQFVPGGNGRFLDFGGQDYVAINNHGLVAFFADLTGTAGGTVDNAGIYVTDGNTIVQMARKGQAAPDGNGTFSGFGYPALNNSGQVAFTATLTGTAKGSVDSQGIFVVDPSQAVLQVVRSGLVVGGETLTSLEFLTGPNSGGTTGLNDKSQVAFWTVLGGNYAVFLWSRPEIATVGRAGNDVLVTLNTVGGTTNYVQATSDLAAGFADIASVVTSGSNLVTTNILDAGAATNTARYYRIRQLP